MLTRSPPRTDRSSHTRFPPSRDRFRQGTVSFFSVMSGLVIAPELKPCLIPSPGLRPPSPGGRGVDWYYFSLGEKVPRRGG
jgi:hypothetical protein